MRDQYELAQECLNVEKSGGDPVEHLKSRGFISPKATWERLQLNELGRGNQKKFKEISAMRKKITREQKEKAVQIYIDGGDPKSYLKSIGVPNPGPSWCSIKAYIKKSKPEVFAEFPDTKKEEKTEEPAEDDRIRKPETPKSPKAIAYSNYSVTAIRHKVYGEFYHDADHNCIDWRTPEGDEMSMSIKAWKTFANELPLILKMLGVDRNE